MRKMSNKVVMVFVMVAAMLMTGCLSEKTGVTTAKANKTESITKRGPTAQSTYPTMNIRGTFNNWGNLPMTQVGQYLWAAKVTFGNTTTERFKFDVYGDWTLNFGLDSVQNGADIPVPAGSVYVIYFNDYYKSYNIDKTSTTIKGFVDGVPGGVNYSFLKAKLFTTYSYTDIVTYPQSYNDVQIDAYTLQSGYLSGKECDITFAGLGGTTSYTAAVDQFDDVTGIRYQGSVTFASNGLNAPQPSQNLMITKEQSLRNITVHGLLNGVDAGAGLYGMTANLYKTKDMTKVIKTVKFNGGNMDLVFAALQGNTEYKVVVTETQATGQKYYGEVVFTVTAANVAQAVQNIDVQTVAESVRTQRFYSTMYGVGGGTDIVGATVRLYKTSNLTSPVAIATFSGVECSVEFTKLERATEYKAVVEEVKYIPSRSSLALLKAIPLVFTTTVENVVQPSKTMEFFMMMQGYKTMNYRGTSNGWAATPMTLEGDNYWAITIKTGATTTERFKVDAYGDWAAATNWGDTNGDLIGDANGKDIPLLANSTYRIVFRDDTKAFTITKQ